MAAIVNALGFLYGMGERAVIDELQKLPELLLAKQIGMDGVALKVRGLTARVVFRRQRRLR